ncbi:hypothetical protein BDZ45DRAFT_741715 [Acephala macrosclerotiorum]|nr:hypothetical protein BDZ45DRAFT_741715 [Acephala macrosclerotiorum]
MESRVSLDYLEPAGLKLARDANKLNAGYAADGYARVEGFTRSYAKMVPVIHIAGVPSTTSVNARLLLHHILGNGDFNVFSTIYKGIMVAQANLNDAKTAPRLTDSTLRECRIQKRPVYLELPTNMVSVTVDAEALEKSLDLSPPRNNLEKEATRTLQTLIQRSNIPIFITPIDKNAHNEKLPNYDFVLYLGPVKSDFNTTGFTCKLSTSDTIEMHVTFTNIRYARNNVFIQGTLERLVSTINWSPIQKHLHPPPRLYLIFLINDDGDSTERSVHEMDAGYNDVQRWRYADIPRAMGGGEVEFIELRMLKKDAPTSLKMVYAAAARTNTA